MKKTTLLVLLSFFFLVGCQSTGALALGGDVYMISRSAGGGVFADIAQLKARVIREANEFAAKRGKDAVEVASELRRPGVGFPSFEYRFRLVDRGRVSAK